MAGTVRTRTRDGSKADCSHESDVAVVYGAYRDAFREDLNHFYSGLAALQRPVIFLELANDEGWMASFDTDGEANEYRRIVESEVPALKLVVRSSVEAALQ